MIQLRALSFGYPQSKPVFENFNWLVQRGETWAVLGTSGCGKTTLLYLLAGLQFPTSGEILIDDQLLTRPRPRTGLILQDYGLLPWATVRQNAELGLKVRNFYGADGVHTPQDYSPERDVSPWLERLGIASIAEKYPSQISGGQRQRAAIARTLALQPDLLLMDEPFSSLDAVIREDLQRLTLELCAESGITLVIVTHNIEEAVAMGRKILLLREPPNREARVFDNPMVEQQNYRESKKYQTLCQRLRRELSHETA
ncbi:MAG: ATP-binding cassette domain-containing protein [Anaerolineales bacterium]|jgi:NitT/TauT family transport system ATP-binding protein